MSDAPRFIKYSVLVPLYNERENITPLYENLKKTMQALDRPFECIFVDDGSTDDSLSLLREIALRDSRVTVVRLLQNSGKSAALCAGFDVSVGESIITLDGDLQHDPADIPRFVEKLEEGYDIVCGWRTRRTDGSLLQRASTRLANWITARLSGVEIHDFGSGFKAYKQELVARLPIYGELQRLIPVLALRRGSRICEVPITTLPRERGVSKYGLIRKLPFFFDLITVRFLLDYLSRPLHFFGTAGIVCVLAGGLTGFWLLLWKFLFGVKVMQEHGPLMFFAGVLIVSGVQLVALGLLAEMQVRHYHERRGRNAHYVVISARHGSQDYEEAIRD